MTPAVSRTNTYDGWGVTLVTPLVPATLTPSSVIHIGGVAKGFGSIFVSQGQVVWRAGVHNRVARSGWDVYWKPCGAPTNESQYQKKAFFCTAIFREPSWTADVTELYRMARQVRSDNREGFAIFDWVQDNLPPIARRIGGQPFEYADPDDKMFHGFGIAARAHAALREYV